MNLAPPDIIGQTGEVVRREEYQIWVGVDDREYRAWSKGGALDVGTEVRVTDQFGIRLDVERTS